MFRRVRVGGREECGKCAGLLYPDGVDVSPNGGERRGGKGGETEARVAVLYHGAPHPLSLISNARADAATRRQSAWRSS